MILLGSLAFASQGIQWLVPPHYEGNRIEGAAVIEVGVSADDLTARVDGELVELEAVPATERGVTTVLSFDASGSFRKFSPRAFDLAEGLINGAGDQDRHGVMVFGRKSERWPASSEPSVALQNLAAARKLAASEKETRLAAFLLQAIDVAADAPPLDDARLRRVVVFTDAGEESEVFSPDEVVQRALHRGVIVDAVVFARPTATSFAEDLDRLARITRRTGGQLVEIHGGDQPDLNALTKGLERVVSIAVPHCGSGAGALELMGPKGFHVEPTVSVGVPEACAGTADREPIAPEVEAVPPAPAVQPPDRLSGLACLLSLLGVLATLAFVVYQLGRRDSARPASAPSAPEPPAPKATSSPPAPTPVDTTPKAPYSPAFDLKLPETHLEVVDGDLPKGTRWRFSGRILRLGALSESNDVVVELPQVSGQHASFEVFPNGTVFVEDLGSANGTWVDGSRLAPHARTQVEPGQQIALSSQLIVTLRTGSDA